MKIIKKSIQFFRYTFYFVFNTAGFEYGVYFYHKIWIIFCVMLNFFRIKSLTDPVQQLLMIENILRVPKSVKGDVVECGCFNGASTVNLSLACALTDRKLFVCDSFEGLPVPKEDEKFDFNAHNPDDFYHWETGEFTSEGGLNGVKSTITKYGKINSCEFVKGYFNESLKKINTDSIVMVFEDADLASSVEDCVINLWPKLQYGCKFFSHEPWSVHVVSVFYDKYLWLTNLKCETPGFFGSGSGIMKAGYYTNIGYAIKLDIEKIVATGSKKVHLGSRGF